jgi:hypothetical protein
LSSRGVGGAFEDVAGISHGRWLSFVDDDFRLSTPRSVKLTRVNLPALVALWARGVDDAARTGSTALSDELLSVRHEISQRLRVRPASAETRDLLQEFDDAFRAITTESAACLYGPDRAAAEGWSSRREWYFWRTAPDA